MPRTLRTAIAQSGEGGGGGGWRGQSGSGRQTHSKDIVPSGPKPVTRARQISHGFWMQIGSAMMSPPGIG